jgi:hypothetical protein
MRQKQSYIDKTYLCATASFTNPTLTVLEPLQSEPSIYMHIIPDYA